MSFEQILKDLKNKVYHPIYLLAGEEPYFIDEISDYIEKNVLNEMEKEFNQHVLYGLETDMDAIIGEAKRFPMMSNHNVIIVKEAQNLKRFEDLISYAENPLSSTILVFCFKHKKFDMRKAIAKKIAAKGVIFDSKKIYDNRMPDWVSSFVKGKGFSISPKVSLLVTEFLGNDLSKITNEIEKIAINLKQGEEITSTIVEKNIGVNKAYNYFELNKALGTKSVTKSNQIILFFSGNEKQYPFPVIIATLYRFFSQLLLYVSLKDKSRNNVAAELKVNPFFVKDYEVAARNYNTGKLIKVISYLRTYDLKSKGVNNTSTTNADLLKEMVFKILHT